MSTKRMSWPYDVATAACLWAAATHSAAAEDTIKIGILLALGHDGDQRDDT